MGERLSVLEVNGLAEAPSCPRLLACCAILYRCSHPMKCVTSQRETWNIRWGSAVGLSAWVKTGHSLRSNDSPTHSAFECALSLSSRSRSIPPVHNCSVSPTRAPLPTHSGDRPVQCKCLNHGRASHLAVGIAGGGFGPNSRCAVGEGLGSMCAASLWRVPAGWQIEIWLWAEGFSKLRAMWVSHPQWQGMATS